MYSERVNFERILLEAQPIRYEIEIDNSRIRNEFDIKTAINLMRESTTCRLESYFATRRIKSKSLKETIKKAIPITYHLVPQSRFQALKLFIYPKWLINKYPIKYLKIDKYETAIIDCEVVFDLTAIYPTIEIPGHNSYVEIIVLKNDAEVNTAQI